MDELMSRLLWEAKNWYLSLSMNKGLRLEDEPLVTAIERIIEQEKRVAGNGTLVIREHPKDGPDLLPRPYYVPTDPRVHG